jgi:hypothetical protein
MFEKNPTSHMTFCDSQFSDSNLGNIPSFTGPVTSSYIGSSAYNSIDLMSSSDEGCSDTMPDLVDPSCHYDSSSDEHSSNITPEGVATATRRSTRIPPTALLPSYFEEDDDDGDEDGEVIGDEEEYLDESGSAYPTSYGTNRVKCYSKRKRSKKKPTNTNSNDNTTNPTDSVEQHWAGSKMWSSSSCPKGICLVVQTTTAVHVVQDCPSGQVYVFRQLTSVVHDKSSCHQYTFGYLRGVFHGHTKDNDN